MKSERIERLAHEPGGSDDAALAARIFADRALWPTFEQALYSETVPTDDERRTIRRVVSERSGAARTCSWDRLRAFVAARLERISGGLDDFALAAARNGVAPSAEGDTAADAGEPVMFVFVSEASEDPAERRFAWRAEMILPPDAAVGAMLPIHIHDRTGEPVAEGSFKVAGVILPVLNGCAEIPYGMFLSGLRDASVELVTTEGGRSPGTLALF